MKQSFLIPIPPVILSPAPTRAFPSESGEIRFSGEISGTAGRSRLSLAPRTSVSGAGPALAGTW